MLEPEHARQQLERQAPPVLVVAAYSQEPQRESIFWTGWARALILRLPRPREQAELQQ
jgi:hypothetical protein